MNCISNDHSTHIYFYPRKPKNCDLLVPVSRDEAEKLVVILVPLDGIKLFPLHVIEAAQSRVLTSEFVTRNHQPIKPYATAA